MGGLDPGKIWENGVNGQKKERIEKQCMNIRVRTAKADILAAMTGVQDTRQPRIRTWKSARVLQESVLK